MLAALGLDENSNAEVAQFFGWWAESLTAAGVKDDVIVHHTGHAGQRSRGASRLLDEPDAIWTLTKDADDDDDGGEFSSLELPTRYLAAYGRDVEMSTEALAYDPFTRRLTLTGEGKKSIGADKVAKRIIDHMRDGKLLSHSALADGVSGDRNKNWKSIQVLIDDGTLFNTGQKNKGKPLWGLAI
jgi:hypothetical protein